MRLRSIVTYLPAAALWLAFAAQAAPTLVRLEAARARALGIETQTLAAGAGAASNLPAQVTVPNEQLRVIAAPLPGMVTQLLVAPGDAVRKDQPLLRLASPALLQAERDYLHAAQQAQLAAQQAARDEALLRDGIIAEARAQASRTAQRQAAATLTEKRETLRLAGVGDAASKTLPQRSAVPGEMVVSAPIDGVVLEQSVVPGQRVEAAAPLLRVGRLDPLWLEIQAPASLAPRLREGVAVLAGGGAATGRLINIGRAIAPGSQTITLRARIDAGAERLAPGQMLEASLQLPDDGSFRLPQAAVVRHEGKAWVFVADGDGFRAIEVSPAGQGGEQVLVRAAELKIGQRVAVRGTAALKAVWLGIGREEQGQ